MRIKSASLFLLSVFSSTLLLAQTGIGTTSPQAKLHIKSNGNVLRLEGSDHAYMEFFPQGSATRLAYFGFPSSNFNQINLFNQSGTGGSLWVRIILPGYSWLRTAGLVWVQMLRQPLFIFRIQTGTWVIRVAQLRPLSMCQMPIIPIMMPILWSPFVRVAHPEAILF